MTTNSPVTKLSPKEGPRSPVPKYKDAKDGTKIIDDDIWLEPFAAQLRKRYAKYTAAKQLIEKNEGNLSTFAEGYKKFGFNFEDGHLVYREWAPSARQLFLTGEFNQWNRNSHEATKNEFGVFTLKMPLESDGSSPIRHATKIKTTIVTEDWKKEDRIPAWSKVVWQEKGSPQFDGVFWNPPPYVWKHPSPPTPKDLRIYEAHVGMSSQEPKISTYVEFARDVLPEIARVGYNAVQLMGIMEHAYYASFGYQVTNFFAVSSRFGTPEELKGLIDRAHQLGLIVLLDLVHSHASKNVADGINQFDGSDHQYFHAGIKGQHPVWDSRLFNYGNYEVQRFLLSNCRFYIEEYRFDGYRFDGVTSMLYKHHGVNHAFVDGYNEYFGDSMDDDAVVYLTLANDLIHSLRKEPHVAVTIAEDVSGLPGIARPIADGGLGFDYRLAMGIPDKWIELFKKGVKDEDWKMGDITWTLTDRRYKEKTIAYAESHDQSLVGDKTIAFWLMDKDMYTNMSALQEQGPVVSRGIALHKMIRLFTYALGGEGYLNFMGNEFGHPEWIDFPRAGNNDNYHYARRRWDLARDTTLRYRQLWDWDAAMHQLEKKYVWLCAEQAYVSLKHEDDKIVAFERGGLFFVFNFHPSKSFVDYKLGVHKPGKYHIVLNSDDEQFGGFKRVDNTAEYFTSPDPWHDLPNSFLAYLPTRTVLVFATE
eukprot:TRINITY_DN2085_c0_g1_i1.p1 TRINITY_DN2085_c0_g1~~TRINITY_DN2085_c0_g1_i1.p1  ORF type:complete len:702 (+),score=184.07 TRINITY_DN2085_c0_g1_i1:141-2246(+)